MMRCDAEWLKLALAGCSDDQLSPILNFGSSTHRFRTVEQPYIHKLVFRPLEKQGIQVVHCDLKEAVGVDVSGDIFNDADLAKLKAVGARSIICTHMLEHVCDREELVRRLMELLPAGGRFFITVPSSYHEHRDPIDTMFRPTPDELAEVFRGQEVLEKKELTGEHYWSQVRRRPVATILRHLARFFVPFMGWRAWTRSMRKLYWLFNPYKVSAVMGRKVGQPISAASSA